MKKFEYAVMILTDFPQEKEMIKRLNELGGEGWEFIFYAGDTGYFKREKIEDNEIDICD